MRVPRALAQPLEAHVERFDAPILDQPSPQRFPLVIYR
jgi:hypothetical protein